MPAETTVVDPPEALYSLDFEALPPEIAARAFPHGPYAKSKPIEDKKYEKRLRRLQIELVKLQHWVEAKGERIVILFEGRDAAGKGGCISRFTQYLNPRQLQVAALAKPTETERNQWYFQRYVAHLPAKGTMTLFDRSWYNRAGVERVMGFCGPGEVALFFKEVPAFEAMLVRDGIRLFKFWLTVSRDEQLKRFYERKTDILKSWKLSPVDFAAVGKWHDFTTAIADIFRRTDTSDAHWTVIDANDQRRARLQCMKVVLSAFAYDHKDEDAVGTVDPELVTTGLGYLERKTVRW
ncbi:MAG TPA: polyphosphate kinase 2 [Aestuariivirgaceae bacterium]|jgi:polyphosphate kinase|nr:polyphosphate kinase 2 [Aestuariivirgaceae bacterium]